MSPLIEILAINLLAVVCLMLSHHFDPHTVSPALGFTTHNVVELPPPFDRRKNESTGAVTASSATPLPNLIT